ncbi:MAG: hypothetical protein ABJZ79_00015 [Parasphingorhabdus sp.]|uniref:hypothetical protein n=1 Tax=Parasphingorhabdus sp. TaxID=2709688 RepID=UPI0032968EBD
MTIETEDKLVVRLAVARALWRLEVGTDVESKPFESVRQDKLTEAMRLQKFLDNLNMKIVAK